MMADLRQRLRPTQPDIDQVGHYTLKLHCLPPPAFL